MEQSVFYSHFKTHDNGSGIRGLIPICNGTLEMSIVAGEFFYCSPREDFDTPDDYNSMELAIFTKDGQWASWKQIDDAGIFSVIGYGEHPEQEDPERSGANVWGYVPVSDLMKVASL